jgi:hypothetical protein
MYTQTTNIGLVEPWSGANATQKFYVPKGCSLSLFGVGEAQVDMEVYIHTTADGKGGHSYRFPQSPNA